MGEITTYTTEMVIAIVFNCAVLFMLLRTSSVKKATSNIFLINLIVADIVTAVMGLVACSAHYARRGMGVKEWTDTKMKTLFMYIFTSTLLILLTATILVTMDRFLAVAKPYLYKEISTKRNVVILMAIIWSIAAVVLILGLIFATLDNAESLRIATDAIDWVLIVITFTGILFLVIANSIILREVRKQVKLVSSISVFGNDKEAAKKSENSLRRKELRAAYLCIMIVCVFTVCWLPISLGLLLNRIEKGNSVAKKLMEIGKALVFVGVILNPCLYVPFKSELKSTFCKCLVNRKANIVDGGSATKTTENSNIQSSV